MSAECTAQQVEMIKGHILKRIWPFSGSAGIRTQDPYIKSVLLYQLSYRTDTSTYILRQTLLTRWEKRE
jgi:hypothetical protein